MMEIRNTEQLNLEELEAQQVELLPDREEMKCFWVRHGDHWHYVCEIAVCEPV